MNTALPLVSVVPVPMSPLFGPAVTLKRTCSPAPTGAIVAVTVCCAPTSANALAGVSVTAVTVSAFATVSSSFALSSRVPEKSTAGATSDTMPARARNSRRPPPPSAAAEPAVGVAGWSVIEVLLHKRRQSRRTSYIE